MSRLKKVIIALAVFAIISGVVNAASLKADYMACVSEDLFDQLMSAITKNDRRAADYLLEHGCIITKAGMPVSVIDTTWTGRAKVRAYAGDDSIILWTVIEAIQR